MLKGDKNCDFLKKSEQHRGLDMPGVGCGGVAILSWEVEEASLRRPLLTAHEAHGRHSPRNPVRLTFLPTFYRGGN